MRCPPARLILAGLATITALLSACASRPTRTDASNPGTQVATAYFLSAAELDTLRADTVRAFHAGDFATLDAIAAHLRTEQPRTPDGGWGLAYFFESFAPENINLPRLEVVGLLENWNRSTSGRTSPNPATATAIFWRRHWKTANATPQDRRAWLDNTREALRNEISDTACPHLSAQRLWTLGVHADNAPVAARIYAEASSRFPGYTPLLESYADWVVSYSEKELGRWLAREADNVGGITGDELYATIALKNPASSYDWIAKRRLDWPRIQRGLESIHSRWPGVCDTIDRLAMAAESHRDRRVLRDALLRIESAPQRAAWSDNLGAYLRARRNAGLEPPSDLRPVLTRRLRLRGCEVTFSPDGKTIVVGCAKGEVLAFSARALRPLWQCKCPRWVSSLAFSPDSRLLAATGGNSHAASGGGIWIWNIETRQLIASDNTLPQRLETCGFTPDGRTLWAAGGVGRESLLLHWRDHPSRFTRLAPPQLPDYAINALAVGADELFFQAGRNLWRLPNGDLNAPPSLVTKGPAHYALALSNDQRLLVTGGWSKNAEWDKPASIVVSDPTAPAKEDAAAPAVRTVSGTRVESLALSRDGLLLAASSSAADFTIWRLTDTEPWLHAYVDDAWTIDDLALSPDASLLATVDTSGHLRLWPLSRLSKASNPHAVDRRWPVK